MPAKVLICDNISPAAADILAPFAQIDQRPPLSESELLAVIADYQAVMIRSQTKMTAQVIEAADQLKIIARAGVGVDNVDIPAATKKGIIVVNSPEGNTIAAAEHTLAMMLSLSRHIPAADASMKQAQWRRNDFMGAELYNKILGIVGLGKIGSHVAKVARSMGMKLVGFDPFISEERARQLEVQVMDLEGVFEMADYLTLHVPNTPETRQMVNAKSIAKMKTGVRIINCARGELIDVSALIQGIESGKIAGAALDVFEKEPLGDSPLLALGSRVILTPHLGASTEEAQLNVALDVAYQVRDVLQGEPASNALNIPSMLPHLLSEVQNYFPLAEKLGLFLGQLQTTAIQTVKITYHGELAQKQTQALNVAIVHGLLSPNLKERVNYVNALLIAKERNIAITTAKVEESHDYTNLIGIEICSKEGSHQVAGSILGETQERIVQIDGFPISCVPKGCLLVIPHPDQPGMVGIIGEILGRHQVNISGIQLGRHGQHGAAVMVVNIDQALQSETLTEIHNHPEFVATKMVQL